jgi:hypothetical protein
MLNSHQHWFVQHFSKWVLSREAQKRINQGDKTLDVIASGLTDSQKLPPGIRCWTLHSTFLSFWYMIFLLRLAAGNSYDGTCIGVLWAQSAVNPTISLKYTVTLSNCSGRTISPAISCWATGLKIYITLSYIALCYQICHVLEDDNDDQVCHALGTDFSQRSNEINPIDSMWDL